MSPSGSLQEASHTTSATFAISPAQLTALRHHILKTREHMRQLGKEYVLEIKKKPFREAWKPLEKCLEQWCREILRSLTRTDDACLLIN